MKTLSLEIPCKDEKEEQITILFFLLLKELKLIPNKKLIVYEDSEEVQK